MGRLNFFCTGIYFVDGAALSLDFLLRDTFTLSWLRYGVFTMLWPDISLDFPTIERLSFLL